MSLVVVKHYPVALYNDIKLSKDMFSKKLKIFEKMNVDI